MQDLAVCEPRVSFVGVENQILCRDAMAKELKLAVVRSLGNDAVDMALRIE